VRDRSGAAEDTLCIVRRLITEFTAYELFDTND
jgi:hypothetical protein